jgi:precorrin-6B methylase 2
MAGPGEPAVGAAPRTLPVPKLAPFNPTADDAIALALSLAAVSPGDVVYDLGCGDGRVGAAAARAGASAAVGVEYDAEFVARAAARAAGEAPAVSSAITILHGDAAAVDLAPATVVFAYLVPAGLAAVEPALRAAARRGARVVTNMFSLKGWEEAGMLRAKRTTGAGLPVYLYGAPGGGAGVGGGDGGGGGGGGGDAGGDAGGGDGSGGAGAAAVQQAADRLTDEAPGGGAVVAGGHGVAVDPAGGPTVGGEG